MGDLYIIIGAILLVLAILGFLFAHIIYLRPWDKTYWEVVAGVGGKDLAESALIGATLWNFDLFWELAPGFPGWYMLFFPWLCSGVSGLSQIYWQEKKYREGRKRAKLVLDNNRRSEGKE